MLGLDLVRVSIDAYLELFEHPTANDRVLIVTWGATFPSESSIEGMLDADRRAYEGWADLIRRGQQDRVHPERHRPGRVRGDPPRHAPRRRQPALDGG